MSELHKMQTIAVCQKHLRKNKTNISSMIKLIMKTSIRSNWFSYLILGSGVAILTLISQLFTNEHDLIKYTTITSILISLVFVVVNAKDNWYQTRNMVSTFKYNHYQYALVRLLVCYFTYLIGIVFALLLQVLTKGRVNSYIFVQVVTITIFLTILVIESMVMNIKKPIQIIAINLLNSCFIYFVTQFISRIVTGSTLLTLALLGIACLFFGISTRVMSKKEEHIC